MQILTNKHTILNYSANSVGGTNIVAHAYEEFYRRHVNGIAILERSFVLFVRFARLSSLFDQCSTTSELRKI